VSDFTATISRRIERPSLFAILALMAALGPLLSLVKTRTLAVSSNEIQFLKHTIDLGASESCAIADVNRDGRLDIVSSENWYEQTQSGRGTQGRRWIKHKFREVGYTSFYIENLIDIAIDVNGDGFLDIVSSSYWSKPFTWWENPGRENKAWRETVIASHSPVEFVFLVDLLGTGKPLQLLPQFGNPKAPLAWYELVGKGAAAKWVTHEVSTQSYGHGIGAGDINGDGRTDIITPKGWFEAPVDRRNERWGFHPEFELGATGFIYALDINADKLSDLVTSLGHDYGIFWFEQRKSANGERAWEKHIIDNSWSQAHALTLADLNGDGRPEIITGKRYMAHNGRDPGEREPLGVYWYEFINVNGRLEWVKHLIDYGSRAGGGMQIPVVDIDRDGDLDVVTPGKSGLFLFEQVQSSEEEVH
jgi:FG-GAP-like repeat/FG-GAP repeat